MENKLLAIITKIEHSSLTESEKNALYETIASGLRATVWPGLYPYMPKDKLDMLPNADHKTAVALTGDILTTAFADPKIFDAIAKLLDEFLVEINRALAAEGIS